MQNNFVFSFFCFFLVFCHLSWKKGSAKELHTGKFFWKAKAALCGLNLITSSFSKVEFSDASSAPKTLFFIMLAQACLKVFVHLFPKGGAGWRGAEPLQKKRSASAGEGEFD